MSPGEPIFRPVFHVLFASHDPRQTLHQRPAARSAAGEGLEPVEGAEVEAGLLLTDSQRSGPLPLKRRLIPAHLHSNFGGLLPLGEKLKTETIYVPLWMAIASTFTQCGIHDTHLAFTLWISVLRESSDCTLRCDNQNDTNF